MINNILLKFIVILAPLPIFINLKQLSFCFNKDIHKYSVECGYPIPFATLVILLLIFIDKFKLVKIIKELALYFILIFLLYLLGLNIKYVILILLNIVFIYVILSNDKILIKNYKYYLVSLLIFIGLHFSYLLLNINKYIFNELIYTKYFTRIFDIEIYQALVSYTSLLSLLFIMIIFLLNFKQNIKNKFLFIIFSIILIFLIMLSYRKLFLVDLTIIFFVCLIINKLKCKSNTKIKSKIGDKTGVKLDAPKPAPIKPATVTPT